MDVGTDGEGEMEGRTDGGGQTDRGREGRTDGRRVGRSSGNNRVFPEAIVYSSLREKKRQHT